MEIDYSSDRVPDRGDRDYCDRRSSKEEQEQTLARSRGIARALGEEEDEEEKSERGRDRSSIAIVPHHFKKLESKPNQTRCQKIIN